MWAALLGAYGEPVESGERPQPEPESDQTLVRVSAALIVPLDLLRASGTSDFGQQPLPYVLASRA
jgi:NADPH:quinone reductase-like Zn-dependent oxidoreductase